MKRAGLLPEVLLKMDEETLKKFQRKADIYAKDGKMAFVLLVMMEFPVLPSEYLGDFLEAIVTKESTITHKVIHISRMVGSSQKNEAKEESKRN